MRPRYLLTPRGLGVLVVVLVAAALSPVAIAGPAAAVSAVQGGEAFLQGQYAEVGVRASGVFGTTGQQPAGFHGNISNRLGFVVDRGKDGWATGPLDGDFFLPGSPYESWTLAVGASTGHNTDSQTTIAGALSNLVTSGDSQQIAWNATGSYNGIQVAQVYSVPNAGQALHADVTLTNTSASTVTNLYYVRGVDPDNRAAQFGSYETTNRIDSQPTSSDRAQVSASNSGTFIALRSFDSRARVARQVSSFGAPNPANVWNGTGVYVGTVGSEATADAGIYLAIKIDSLAAGASTDFRVSYVLSEAAINEGNPALELSTASSTVAENAGNATFTVAMGEAKQSAVTVDYATSDGTATAAADYSATSGTLTIPAGQSSGTISVPITDDTGAEADETFTLTLSNPTGSTLGTIYAQAVTIDSDDVAAPAVVTGASAAAANGSATVSWNASSFDGDSPLTGYTVTASPVGATCVTSGATSCTVLNLMNGTSYTFTVAATNATGTSAPSAPTVAVMPVGATTATLTASASPVHSSPVTLTAAITGVSNTGSVSFLAGGVLIGVANVSGTNATLTVPSLPAGTQSLSAVYSGVAGWTGSIGNLSLTVAKATQTIALTAPDAASYGSPLALVASASSGLPVTLLASGPCSLDAGWLSLTDVGTCSVRASQAGDGNFVPAASIDRTIAIGKGGQTVSVAPFGAHTFGDLPFAVETSASSGLPVTISAVGSCVASGVAVAIISAGDCTITVAQGGDSRFTASSVTASVKVAAKRVRIVADETQLFQTADGGPRTVPVRTEPADIPGLVVTYDGLTDAPWAVGRYQVVATLVSTDYVAEPLVVELVLATPFRLVPVFSAETLQSLPTPVLTPDGVLPELLPGQSILLVDGVPTPVTIMVTAGDLIDVVGDGFTATLSAVDDDDQRAHLDHDGNLILTAGNFVVVTGRGFVPGSRIDIWLFSNPRMIGTATVTDDGSFSAKLPMPADTAVGRHTLQMNGTSFDGQQRSLSLGVSVAGESAAGAAELSPAPPVIAAARVVPAGGSDAKAITLSVAIVMLTGAFFLLIWSRRRRDQEPVLDPV